MLPVAGVLLITVERLEQVVQVSEETAGLGLLQEVMPHQLTEALGEVVVALHQAAEQQEALEAPVLSSSNTPCKHKVWLSLLQATHG
jgi:hypothetical protein